MVIYSRRFGDQQTWGNGVVPGCERDEVLVGNGNMNLALDYQ